MNATHPTCTYPNCDRDRSPKAGGGLCLMHYARSRRSGSTAPTPRKRDVKRASSPFPMSPAALLRFIEKVDEAENGCWIWTATTSRGGYGMFMLDKLRAAHRVSYMNFVGPIPDGMDLDHLCRVRHCVNPQHLEPVTAWENWNRGTNPAAVNSRKTHCIRGHEFTPENTITRRNGGRGCKACSQRTAECPVCGAVTMARGMKRHQQEVHGMEATK